MASADPAVDAPAVRPASPPPRGIITVLNTPFTADAGGVDLRSLRQNVERAIDAGVAGFLVPALASEVGKLQPAERTQLISAVVDEVETVTSAMRRLTDGRRKRARSGSAASEGAASLSGARVHPSLRASGDGTDSDAGTGAGAGAGAGASDDRLTLPSIPSVPSLTRLDLAGADSSRDGLEPDSAGAGAGAGAGSGAGGKPMDDASGAVTGADSRGSGSGGDGIGSSGAAVERPVVVGGASAETTEERVELAMVALSLGCDAVLVNIPFDNEKQWSDDVRAVAAVVSAYPPGDRWLMVQDWSPTGYGVPVDAIVRLFGELDCFRSLKIEVVNASIKYSEVLAKTEGRLHVAGGWAVMQMVEALDRGVHAFMPTAMHLLYTRIFSLHRCGDRAGARALFDRVLPVLAFSNQHLDISIHFFKRLLAAERVYSTARCRQPLLPFDSVHEAIAKELIAHVVSLQREVQAQVDAERARAPTL